MRSSQNRTHPRLQHPLGPRRLLRSPRHCRLRAPTHLPEHANWPPTHLSDPADPSNWGAGTLAEDALTPLLQVHQIPLQSYYHVFELPIYKAFEVTI